MPDETSTELTSEEQPELSVVEEEKEPPVEEPATPVVEEEEEQAPAEEPTLPVAEEEAEQPPAEEFESDLRPVETQTGPSEAMLNALAEKEAELERLHMENARLRQSVIGATEVIEELEEPPMPPLVENNIVVPAHVVSDFVRMGRQLDREHLIRATMGSLAMISPDQPNIMVSSRNMTMLPRMNERSLCAGQLGGTSPRGAPSDWHVMEVVLASVAMVTGGPAAVIHMHGPHTTAASCEKDLVLLNPIDEIGKHHIGKIIVVDPDEDQPEDYLRQVAEALKQGNMRCVVVRGNGAYAVGADFDQAWGNAAILEHSMHIHLLSRQANLKL